MEVSKAAAESSRRRRGDEIREEQIPVDCCKDIDFYSE